MANNRKTPSLTLRQVLKHRRKFLLPSFPTTRCRRSEFAWSMLVLAFFTAVLFLPQYLLSLFDVIEQAGFMSWMLTIVDGGFALWLLWCVMSLTIRRINDTRFRAFANFVFTSFLIFTLLFLYCGLDEDAGHTAVFDCLIIMCYCLFIDSEKGDNPYGQSLKYAAVF